MAVSPVPQKAAFYAAANYWIQNAYTFINASPVGTYSGTTAIQYDGEMCAYRELDRTGDGATWNPIIQRLWQEQNYYVNTIASPAGAVAAYLSHTDGYTQDKIRATARSASSLANVRNMAANGAYMTSNGGDPMETTPYSREVAYCASCLINLQLCGDVLTAAQLSRLGVLYGYWKLHMDAFAVGGAPYVRPFMVALSCKFGILYYDNIADSTEKAVIQSKIAAVSTYIWNTCWKSTSGAWGAANAFLYTDRTGYDAADGFTQPDLNMLIAPLYGWLWSKTGDIEYRTKGDAIFQGGIPVYSGAVYISGAYQGTPAGPACKQIFEQSFWGHKYVDYAEVDVNPVIMSDVTCTTSSVVFGTQTLKATKVTFAATNTDYAIGVPTGTNRIFVCGAMYQEADAHTLTFKSGTNVIQTYQRTAFDGFLKEPGVKAFIIGEPGETIYVQSTVVIVDVLFYYYESTQYRLT